MTSRLVLITLLALATHVPQTPASEGRWILAEVTAYCPCALCCDVRTERTANGTNTDQVPYGVAASPNIRLGSYVYIPTGIGYLDVSFPDRRSFIADDRGGALRSDWQRTGITRLDLRYKTHWSAQQFGRKTMMVYITDAHQPHQQTE